MVQEEEGSSSNRPELAAFLPALHNTLIEEPLLYLCDNQSLLKAVHRGVGEGGKTTLVVAPDADIWQLPSRHYERGLQRGGHSPTYRTAGALSTAGSMQLDSGRTGCEAVSHDHPISSDPHIQYDW